MNKEISIEVINKVIFPRRDNLEEFFEEYLCSLGECRKIREFPFLVFHKEPAGNIRLEIELTLGVVLCYHDSTIVLKQWPGSCHNAWYSFSVAELKAFIHKKKISNNVLKDEEGSWLCPNCDGIGQEPHTCPYQEDVNEDSVSLCTCCDSCIEDCTADI